MTFFLNEKQDISGLQPRGPDVAPGGFFEGLGAAFNKASLENDANFRLWREKNTQRGTLASQALGIMGEDAVRKDFEARGIDLGPRGRDMSISDFVQNSPNAGKRVLEMAREQASANPGLWEGIDLTDEGIDAQINKRLQAEHADAEAILNMLPGSRASADFIGGMAGITVDIKNLPFMLMGGSGSIFRVMAREAAINVAAEAAFLPAQFEMADRLNIPDPDIATQLAMAAGAGAVIGGGVEAATRAARYAFGRSALPVNADPIFDAHAIDAAEDAIVAGENPFDAAQRVRDEAPPPEPPAPRAQEPLIPETANRPDAVDTTSVEKPATVAQAVDAAPQKTDEKLADVLRPDADQINSMADTSLASAMAEDSGKSKPLVSFLRDSHRVTKAEIRAAEKAGRPAPTAGENYQINPDGAAGQELKAMGVNARTAPGLFAKSGRDDFDNLVASEMEEKFPGISAATGVSDDGMYLDRQGFIDLIRRDAEGDSSWLQSRADAAKIEADREASLRALESGDAGPANDFLSGQKADGGFFIDLNTYGMLHPDDMAGQIRADLDAHLRGGRWADYPLTPEERAEILNELQARGGDADYLIQRALERDLDYVDLPPQKADDYGQYDPEEYDRFLAQSEAQRVFDEGRSGAEGPIQDTDPTRQGGTGADGDSGVREAGAGGTSQLSIPGTDRVATANLDKKISDTIGNPRMSEEFSNGDLSVTESEVDWSVKLYSGEKAKADARIVELRKLIDEVVANPEMGYDEKYARASALTKRIMLVSEISNPAYDHVSRAKKGSVTFSKEIEAWEQDLVNSVLSEFGFDRAISVERVGSAKGQFGKMINDKELNVGAAIGTSTGFFSDKLVIAIPRSKKMTARGVEKVLHEMGHLLEHRVVAVTPNARTRLLQSWLNSIDLKLDAYEGYFSQKAFASQRKFSRPESPKKSLKKLLETQHKFVRGETEDRYLLSFSEWFADQTARFLETDEIADGFLGKFFSKIASYWKEVSSVLRGKGFVSGSVVDLFNAARVKPALQASKELTEKLNLRSEPTAAGEQTLIDGVAPITQRDRLEARQNAPLNGGRQSALDSNIGGLFDPDDKVRNDLFDDPLSPKASPIQDDIRADIQDRIEADGDSTVDMEDGLGPRPASSVLDELNMDDEFQAVLDACGKPRGKA